MYKFYTIFKRDVINLVKNPTLLMFNTAFPFLLILILGFLSSGSYGKSGIDAYDYYGITILLYIALNVSVTAANSFMEKSLKNSNLRIMYSPISISFIYLSKIAATFAFTSVCFMALAAASGLLLGVNFGGGNTIYTIIMVLLLDLLSSSLGVMFCCIFKSEELTNKILSTANNILAVLGGLFFQLDGFGRTVEGLTCISPVKWVVQGIFRIIYDNDFSWFYPTVLILLVLSAAMVLLCKLTFRTEDYL